MCVYGEMRWRQTTNAGGGNSKTGGVTVFKDLESFILIMAAKINIASSTHSTAELSTILSEYTTAPIKSSKQLFGGYSGSSYLVELDASPSSPTQYVLKVSNGYTHDDAEFMCRTAAYLGSVGFEDCCLPIPKMKQKRDPSYVYVSKLESNGVPSFLLTYVKGQQADKIMRESPHLAKVVMRGIGGGLGRMHALSSGIDAEKAKASGIRWYENDGGCCDVQDQYEDKILGKIMSDPDASQHEFVEFYKRELTDLKNELGLVKAGMFDMGVTHGDPFADNIMSNPEVRIIGLFLFHIAHNKLTSSRMESWWHLLTWRMFVSVHSSLIWRVVLLALALQMPTRTVNLMASTIKFWILTCSPPSWVATRPIESYLA